MRPEVKQAWIEALLSEQYSPTIGRLRDEQGFCALGVLCDLHSRWTGVRWEYKPGWGYSYLGSQGYPPIQVLHFADLSPRVMRRIADWSDLGMPFYRLANRIRRYVD